MHSKFVLLLLSALQVSYASEWERPHVRYYSRSAEHSQPDSYACPASASNFEDSCDQPSKNDDHCPPHHSEFKPVHEDQDDDVPRGSDSCRRDGGNQVDEHSEEDQSKDNAYLQGRPRHEDCEIFVNPIRPPFEGPSDKCGIFVNPIRPRFELQSDKCGIYVNPIHQPFECPCDKCGILVNPLRPPFEGPSDKCGILVNPLRPPFDGPSDRCGIFIHPIRPPFEGSSDKVPIENLSANYIAGGQPASELPSCSRPGEGINSKLGAPESINRDIQASIANAAINQQIGTAVLRAQPVLGIAHTGPMKVSPLLPFLPSGAGIPINQPFTGPLPLATPNLPSPFLPSPNFCIRHRLIPVPVRVIEECITNVPVVRKTLRHQVQTVTRNIPIFEKTVTEQHEKIVRHVPIAGKTLRNVVETRVRHVPVIKCRTRNVVEPYTVHVPVTLRFIRPVEESITKTVPVQEFRVRPVATERTRLVPVIERRLRPIVEQRIQNIPVKKTYLRTVVEQRVHPVIVPCQPCPPFRPNRLPMSIFPAGEIPRILLSPYSDTVGTPTGAIISQSGASNNGCGAISGDIMKSRNILLTGPTNSQIAVSCGEQSGASSQPIHLNSGIIQLSPSSGTYKEMGVPPNAHHIIPNIHETDCSPQPESH